MKLKQYLTEANNVYYHATYKKFLPKLKREGIKARKKALHTNAFGGDVRDDKESVYAITDENEALKLAFGMNWKREPSKEVVLIKFRPKGKWEKDTHWQAQAAKGTWVRSRQVISPKDFVGFMYEDEIHKLVAERNKAGTL